MRIKIILNGTDIFNNKLYQIVYYDNGKFLYHNSFNEDIVLTSDEFLERLKGIMESINDLDIKTEKMK